MERINSLAQAHVQKKTEHSNLNHDSFGRIDIKDRFFLQALRSVGYDVYTAIAELIDNSIDAGATKIKIDFDSKSAILVITDNGIGMSKVKLNAAMDLGADQEYSDAQIGYFGSGMKTSIANLVTKPESLVTIDSYDGNEATIIEWKPLERFREFSFNKSNKKDIGTAIIINGVEKFQIATLKKQLGVVFYPTLKTETLELTVNGVEILPTDPLYRYSDKVRFNHVVAKVLGYEIRIEAVLLHPEQEKSSWDSADNGESRFSFNKGGAYVQYGGRYIEYGGLLHIATNHPDYNWIRFEFAVPKELTEIFGVKFNKTNGLNLDRKKEKNEALSDLIQKVRDMLSWGRDQRKKANIGNASDEDKSELDEITKKLNDAARRARFIKPQTENNTNKQTEEYDEINETADPETQKPGNKEPRKTKIHKFELYDIRFENLGNTAVFWNLGYENNKFIITINDSHVFYTEYWVNMNDTAKTAVSFLLGAIAQAQYNSEKENDNIQGVRSDFFWEMFWSQVSLKLRHLTLS
jgi:hypothetical protein